jgi:hypothetical protein
MSKRDRQIMEFGAGVAGVLVIVMLVAIGVVTAVGWVLTARRSGQARPNRGPASSSQRPRQHNA